MYCSTKTTHCTAGLTHNDFVFKALSPPCMYITDGLVFCTLHLITFFVRLMDLQAKKLYLHSIKVQGFFLQKTMHFLYPNILSNHKRFKTKYLRAYFFFQLELHKSNSRFWIIKRFEIHIPVINYLFIQSLWPNISKIWEKKSFFTIFTNCTF